MTTPHRYVQGSADLFGLQAGSDMVAHDFVGPGIGDQAQVRTLAARGQVRNVSHPDLLGPGGLHLVGSFFEQIGMTPETMMTLCGLVVGPLGWHKQMCRTQNRKQAIPCYGVSKAGTKYMMQLARAQARLMQPDRLHQLNHLLGLARSGPLSLAPLVIRLATDADKAASSLDAQSGDLTTTDSLPEDFFTVIPCSSRMISMTVSNRADFSFSSCGCFSSSLIRCSGVNGLFDVLGMAAPGLRRPRGEVQSCKPCLRHHTKTVEQP